MGQRITISEAEKNRIKGLYEQSKPNAPLKLTGDLTGDMKGSGINLYLDEANKRLFNTTKIEYVKRGTDTTSGFEQSLKVKLFNFPETTFSCGDKFLRLRNPNDSTETLHKFYSNLFIQDLSKRFCTKSSGGSDVPKMRYAKTSSASSDMV